MELMQLRYFQVVALNQHITRSAEQLNVPAGNQRGDIKTGK